MLKTLPSIYVGKETYASYDDLAKKIASGKNLGASLKKLAKELEAKPEDEELGRLVVAIERHAKDSAKAFERAATENVKSAIKALNKTAKAYEGTPWASELVALSKQAKDRQVAKRYSAAHKKIASARRLWEQLQPQKGNGGQVRNPLDSSFRSTNASGLEQLTPQLEELAKEFPELPAGRVAANWLELLRK